ncbi:MAG: YggT family protein, partial [Arcobacter skirrowii]|nr:YggT family protein [Aliarcobacter skirrowii]
MIDALIGSFLTIFFTIIFLYKWIVIISALLTWVRPDPYNP